MFWIRKFWKIGAFDYNQHKILIMNTNARFHSIGATSDFGTKFAQNYMNDKTFEKNHIRIVTSL